MSSDTSVAGTDPRIPALEPPYPPDLAVTLDKWMPPNSGHEPLALFRVLARHAELFSRSLPLGAGILGKGTVPPRLREVMILRTSALAGAEYEWGVHATSFGAAVGLSSAQVRATARGSADDGAADDPVWDGAERAVFRLADQLHAGADVSDALFAELAAHFSHEQVIELCLTAGWYHAIAYVINTARIPLEPWAERFPT
jgi:alkylhydroperoxidase family enzyme